jgi:hypothetical protein
MVEESGLQLTEIQVEEVLLEDNITTEPTWINTILVISERSECGTSTSRATTSGPQSSTSRRYVQSAVGIMALEIGGFRTTCALYVVGKC